MRHTDPATIVEKLNVDQKLSQHISMFGGSLEDKLSDYDPRFELYKNLEVKFSSLSEISGHNELLNFAVAQNLYDISFQNVKTATSRSEHPDPERFDFTTANFSYVLTSGNPELVQYIEENIQKYLDDVLLKLATNREEQPDTILRVLQNTAVSVEARVAFSGMQNHVFADFEAIPADLHRDLLENGSVALNWTNFGACYLSEEGLGEGFQSFLGKEENVSVLESLPIDEANISQEDRDRLNLEILSSETLDDAIFKRVIGAVGPQYKSFPTALSRSKQQIAAEAGKIALNTKSFEQLEGDDELTSALILANPDAYCKEIEAFPVSQKTKLRLYHSTHSQLKLTVAQSLSAEEIADGSELSSAVSSLLQEPTTDHSLFEHSVLVANFANVSDTEDQIEYLSSIAGNISNDEALGLVATMVEPYSKIADRSSRALVDDTDSNRKLLRALKGTNAISSFREEKGNLRVYHPYMAESTSKT